MDNICNVLNSSRCVLNGVLMRCAGLALWSKLDVALVGIFFVRKLDSLPLWESTKAYFVNTPIESFLWKKNLLGSTIQHIGLGI